MTRASNAHGNATGFGSFTTTGTSDRKRKAATNGNSVNGELARMSFLIFTYINAHENSGPGTPSSHSHINYPAPSPSPGPSSSNANGKSLFASILAMPPAKRARTIHNPEAPPIVAPTHPTRTSQRQKSPKKDSKKGKESKKAVALDHKAETEKGKAAQRSTRSGKGKAKEAEQPPTPSSTSTRSPRRRGRVRAGSAASTVTASVAETELEGNNDYSDMSAAAVLTDLMHSRGVGSPRGISATTSASRMEEG